MEYKGIYLYTDRHYKYTIVHHELSWVGLVCVGIYASHVDLCLSVSLPLSTLRVVSFYKRQSCLFGYSALLANASVKKKKE